VITINTAGLYVVKNDKKKRTMNVRLLRLFKYP